MDMRGAMPGRIIPAMSERFEENVRKDFGKLLMAARKAKGYKSAAAFADMLKVEPPRYRYWERGQAMPDVATVVRITNLLNVELSDLLPRGFKRERDAKKAKHLSVVG